MEENSRVIMPHNIEAEQNLLGLLLNNNENMNKIGDVLKGEYFYLPIHTKIYEGISKLMDKGLVSDPITIKNYFSKDEIFDNSQVSSYEYLLKLVEEAQLTTDIKTLANNIYDTHIRRKIIDLAECCVLRAKEEKIDEGCRNLIEEMEHELYKISNSNSQTEFDNLTDSIKETLMRIEESFKRKSDISGIETGYIDLNSYTGGFQRSDLIIIGGRPSMGKTALTVNMALRAAKSFAAEFDSGRTNKKKHVCFFSLEMSADQLASRVLSIESKIDGSKIRVGNVNKNEFKSLSEQISILDNIPFIIDDTPALTISAIRTRARRMKRQYDVAILIVDYLQLINGKNKNRESRVQEIGEISQGLKAIAKELDIPVITVSQLSRAVEYREDKRPLLSDLRESGNIEQDADIVIFIYREEYYLSRKIPSSDETKLLEWQEKMDKVENIAEIIIAKQRNGPVGNFSLRYDNKTTAFDNLSS